MPLGVYSRECGKQTQRVMQLDGTKVSMMVASAQYNSIHFKSRKIGREKPCTVAMSQIPSHIGSDTWWSIPPLPPRVTFFQLQNVHYLHGHARLRHGHDMTYHSRGANECMHCNGESRSSSYRWGTGAICYWLVGSRNGTSPADYR